MTLKTRLAAMMVLVLVAVVAVQFVMAERERRELAARLAALSGDLERSTAFFVERVHDLAARRPPEAVHAEIEQWLAGIAADSGGTRPATTVQVLVFTDSSPPPKGTRPPPVFRAGVDIEHSIIRRDSLTLSGEARRVVWMRDETVVAPGDSTMERRVARFHHGGGTGEAERDFVVNLPLPAAHTDSVYSLQMRYSYASLAEELSRSRRRSVLWLAALLGLGVAAAIAVAGQFTRPIRALEASFARVEAGDLATRVQPQRNDEIGHLTASFNDMVARLRTSQAMADRLAQSEHLASIGRMAASIAHEVRNPLNAILLNLEQLRDRGGRPGPIDAQPALEFDKYHERIAGEIRRLDHLVTTFLDLAKSGELRTEPTDVASSLRSAVELFQPVAAERGVRLDLEAPESVIADADPQRLPAVWNNLLANALDATPRGGTVAVRAAVAGDGFDVTMSDDGEGIAPELQAQVFEPFQSGREGGTGLGLAIVRATVEGHGGTVTLQSQPGAGTRVDVHLPLQREVVEDA